MPGYRITQDRWCWCGHPAALVVVRGEAHQEYVCSEYHGEIAIKHLERKDKRERESPTEHVPIETDTDDVAG